MKLASRVLRRELPAAASQATALKLPTMPSALYAVGDLHGCLDLYRALETRILEDGAEIPGPKLIVVLGDVIDRGPDTARIIDHLVSPMPAGWQRLVLRGNHEDMMLKFLAAPEDHYRWLDFGGHQTLLSYGLQPDSVCGFRLRANRVKQMVGAAIPKAHIAFLNQLPLSLEVGPFFLSHAGGNPQKPLAEQSSEDLMWGSPMQEHDTDYIAVHGHILVPEAQVSGQRLNLDTGAYVSGILSGARLCSQQDIRLFAARNTNLRISHSPDG